MSRKEGMQLEDWNQVMLRAIYGIHLALYGVVVFLVGLLLVPVGYLCVLIMRLRAIVLAIRMRSRRSLVMSTPSNCS